MKPIGVLRNIRDVLFYLFTFHKSEVVINGLRFSVRDLSMRMRYVMFRGYEIDDAHLAIRHLSPSDSVVEVGSSIGFMAVHCIGKVGVRDYQMVEANPNLISSVRRNFTLNGLSAPRVINAAVTGANGSISFGISNNSWSSSILSRSEERERITVEAITLQRLVELMPFRPNTLIMDIEGAEAGIPPEHFVLFDKVLIEVHPKLVGQEAIDALLSGLETVGFRKIDRKGASYCYMR